MCTIKHKDFYDNLDTEVYLLTLEHIYEKETFWSIQKTYIL